jgi:tubulin-specific chaperone D
MSSSSDDVLDITLPSLLDTFLTLFSSLPADTKERVAMPLLEVTDVLIGSGVVGNVVSQKFWTQGISNLFDCVKREVLKSRDVKKLSSAIKVYVHHFCYSMHAYVLRKNRYIGMSTLSGESCISVKRKALKELVWYLAHPFPKVRQTCSEGLYIALTTSNEVEESQLGTVFSVQNLDHVEELLLTTDW